MDPNETLRIIRQELESAESDAHEVDVDRLVEHVRALDEWLSSGGFLPKAWDGSWKQVA